MMVLDALLITSTSVHCLGLQDGNGMLNAATASWLELRGAGGRQVCPAPWVDRKWKWVVPRGSASSVALARGLLLVRCWPLANEPKRSPQIYDRPTYEKSCTTQHQQRIKVSCMLWHYILPRILLLHAVTLNITKDITIARWTQKLSYIVVT